MRNPENLSIKYFFLSLFLLVLAHGEEDYSHLLLELLIIVSESAEWFPDYAKQIVKQHRKVSNI